MALLEGAMGFCEDLRALPSDLWKWPLMAAEAAFFGPLFAREAHLWLIYRGERMKRWRRRLRPPWRQDRGD